MAKVLVVYHTQSGNTQALAKAVGEGTKKAGAEVVCKLAAEVKEDDFLWADVFDWVFYLVKDRVKSKPFGVFVTHGGGGTPAVESIRKLASNLGLKEKIKPLLVQGKPDEAGLEQGREFGRKLAG